MKRNGKSTPLIKRVFDVLFSLIVVIILSPVLIVVLIVLVISDGFPVFFTQTRPGKSGNPFELHKFRTMKVIRNQNDELSKESDRITKFGNILRKTRFDEVPQVLNIILGHMSFIGPRPERPEFILELEKEVPFYRERMLVKPGATGWDQV